MQQSGEKITYREYKTLPLLADEETLSLEENLIKDRSRITLECTVASLENAVLILGHGYGLSCGSWIEVDSSNVSAYNYFHFKSEPLCTVLEPTAHGLKICGKIKIKIIKDTLGGSEVIITTPSGSATVPVPGIAGYRGAPCVTVKGGEIQDVTLGRQADCYSDPIWVFGDSYLTHTDDDRWPYYLYRDGYSKLLLAGYGGMGSAAGLDEFKRALRFGKPTIALWCLGMNNGDGDNNTPNEKWLLATEEFLKLCDENGIEPILATIPSTPKVNNEPKNSWVRTSGRRYIDFNRAVGADRNIEWLDGMLTPDLVHPAPAGAIALYNRVLQDVPEIKKMACV